MYAVQNLRRYRSLRALAPRPAGGVLQAAAGLALAFAGIALLAFPSAGIAAPPVAGTPVVSLGFGERYGVPAKVHSGIDVVVEAGDPARSAVAGVVTFAGLVPATGGEFRVGAVSVQRENGHTVTLSPLEGLRVVKGDHVVLGQPVGLVAPGGDVSTTTNHLHLSERVSGRYVDPSHLLEEWLSTYVAEAVGPSVDSSTDGAERPLPSRQPITAHTLNAQPSAVDALELDRRTATGSPGEPAALAAPGASVAPLAHPVAPPALVARRENMSHLASTLQTANIGAGESIVSGRAAQRDAALSAAAGLESGDRFETYANAFRFLGAGLVALAAGLGFALHMSGGSEGPGAIHRLGSLFAVRGERW